MKILLENRFQNKTNIKSYYIIKKKISMKSYLLYKEEIWKQNETFFVSVTVL